MMAEETPSIYTITVDFLYELIEEAESQVSVTKILLQDFLAGTCGNKDLLTIVVEILWANNCLLSLLDSEIETAVLKVNEETGEQEFLLPDTSMATLQQLVVAKYYAILDLTKRSFSISLH